MTPGAHFATRSQKTSHIFFGFVEIEFFWKQLIDSLKHHNLLSNDYTIDNLVVLGLSSDTSKNKKVNYILLLARFYIWLCRSKENIPTIENLKPFLKQYKKEIEPFCIW